MESLGSRKGYALVGCSLSGINAFFVKHDLVQDKFCTPFTAENHFEPPRFGFYKVGALDMHPAGVGNMRLCQDDLRGQTESAACVKAVSRCDEMR